MIQTNGGVRSVFQTTVRKPTISKEEVQAPRETLIKAGYCNTLLCLVCESLCDKNSNDCVAQIEALNMTGRVSDGYTVQGQSVDD